MILPSASRGKRGLSVRIWPIADIRESAPKDNRRVRLARLTLRPMNESEFSWRPIHSTIGVGMHLVRNGTTYAAVTVMEGEPWLAILNLHQDTTKVRSVPFDNEADAIQAVECWLEGLLASQ